MSEFNTTVDVRHLKEQGRELVKEVGKLCDEAIRKTAIWSQYTIPHKVLITLDQFKEFATLQEEPNAKPTGKEIFKSGAGFLFEIKVEEN